MNSWHKLGDYIVDHFKGITPKYVENSQTIVLNQKCIRNNSINFNLARFHSDEKNYNSKKALKIGDLLFNSTGQGTAGRCTFVKNLPGDKKVITDSHILVLRLSNPIIAECFSYLFYSKESFIQTFMDGSTGQGELDKLRLFNVEFRVPEIGVAKTICQLFNYLDAKIELNNQINTELEAMAKLVYDYWFVQFDFPFDFAQGKPDTNGKPYKSSGGKMVYNEVLKREIPEGWGAGNANKIIKFNPTESVSKGKSTSYIDMNALPTSGYMTSAVKEKEFSGGMKFRNDDVLVARITPCLENGKTCLVSLLEDNEIGFGSTEYIVLRGKKKPIPAFASFLARSEYFRKYAILNMTGTSGRKRVDYKQLELIKIPIPPEDLLDSFEDLVYPHFEKMTLNTKENQELTSLRDWLLPMLMNGQVTVGEAYDIVEEKLGMVAEGEVKYGEG